MTPSLPTAGFSSEDLELLAYMLEREGLGAAPAPQIPLRQPDGPIPLSPAQERLWVLDQLDPGSPAYAIPFALRMRGRLDAGALQRSLSEIVRRHEALRTCFPARGGQPVQVVLPPAPLPLPEFDLRGAQGEAALAQRLAEEARRPFDLARGPLVRAALLRLADSEVVLVLSIHHIVFDGWSISRLIEELGALYSAFAAGRPPELAPLPIQYADFAVWQREQLAGPAMAEELAYWRAQLAELPSGLDLPFDRPRPPVSSYQGAVVTFEVAPGLADALRRLSQQEGVTLFTTLLAAFQILLARYTDQEDIVVGTPVANRDQLELEPLIGLFINTLVLRTSLAGQPSFRQALRRAREVVGTAFAHQHLPFEQLVKELEPDRDLSRHPLFQVLFALHTGALDTIALPGLSLERVRISTETAKFDLSLNIEERARGLSGAIEYRSDLFDAATVERMARHLQTLLAAAVDAPDVRIGDLPLLDEAERRQIAAWNTAAPLAGPALCVHEQIAQQARRTPDAVAVVDRDGSWTYAQLEGHAGALAALLARQGVRRGARVGICAERSLAMVAGLLAILKAGAAYVPLDPGYPPERLALMVGDSRMAALLTQPHLRERLPALDIPVILADCGGQTPAQPDEPPAAVTLDDPAYVIYTSGSTGRPKGAAVYHRGLDNLVRWYCDTFDLTAADSFLIISSLSFDLTQKNLFAPLTRGGALYLTCHDAYDPQAILRQIEAHRISVLNCTPSAAYPLVEQCGGDAAPLASLRYLFLGGEPIALARLRPWTSHPTFAAQIVNTYGPTECSDVTTFYPVDPDEPARIPIGRPVARTRHYIVDRQLRLLPVGASGELCIGGVGVGNGYISDAARTAAVFVPDPYGEEPGARMYRTGDRARYRADGAIEFLGRIDQQVKLRGFRIEPGEIEAALGDSPAVEQAAVVLHEDAQGVRRLVAYVLPAAGQRPSADELRSWLHGRLPEHMVPAAFVPLERLPLTPSGKLDRRALPAPDFGRAALGTAYAAPRTSAEQTLAAVWEQVLGAPSVGVHDRFFELGGDSILAVQVVARAAQAGLHLTPRQLFQHPTVAELAAVAQPAPAIHAEQELLRGDLPLTPIQRWFFAQERGEPHHYNQALMLAPRGPLEPNTLAAALAALLRHHDALRLRFVRSAEGWRQSYAEPDDRAPVDVVDLSAAPPEQHDRAIEQAAGRLQASLDLARGPLVRAALFKLGAGQPDRLLLICHHLLVDGISWRILVEDLATLYRQLDSGEPAALPAKTSSYRSWAERLADYAASPALAEEAGYWRALASQPWEPLPLDLPQGRNTGASARTHAVRLDPAATAALLYDLPPVYRTQIGDVLLAALARAITAWSGAACWLDLEGHGREPLFDDIDLTRTVGWCTTLTPVRLDPAALATPAAALKYVKEQLRQIPQRGVGFGVLRYLAPGGPLAEAVQTMPAPQISFNYFGQIEQGAQGGLFGLDGAPRGALHSPGDLRSHLWDITCQVAGDCLQIDWRYSADLHRPATIERLAAAYLEELRLLIAHCRSPEAGGLTPSDVPLAALDQDSLDRLFGNDRTVEEIYPLTPIQSGMLFHTLYDPQAGVYVNQISAALEGELDQAAFQRAWQQVLLRHANLRSAFLWEGQDTPLQIVRRDPQPAWLIERWDGLPADEQQARLAAYLAADRAHGFDPARAPLLRFALFRTGPARHQFVWSYHHILLDGWSLPIVLDDLWRSYALALGRGEPLRPARPYRDYLAWLQRRPADEAERHWRGLLAGAPTPTPFNIDQTPSERSGPARYHDQTRALPAELSQRLGLFARRQNITLNTVVQAAWALLLSCYSGQSDVVFGATVAGRPTDLAGSDQMVGLFINTLPVRVRVEPGQELAGWLDALQAQLAAARQYEHTPLVRIQEWGGAAPGQPLFESIVVFENYPVGERLAAHQAGGLPAMAGFESYERTNYPLTILVRGAQDLELQISYDCRRFAGPAVERMLGHLEALLEQLSGGHARRLGQISPLSPPERRRLAEWNATAVRYADLKPIHTLIEAQAARTPQALALVFEGQSLTYQALNRRANQLARWLRRRGVGPDVLVGVRAERSLELVVALLGVLKAGGAYVPIDPAYPAERQRFMLEDARPAVLITSGGAAADTADLPAVDLVADWPQIAREGDSDLPNQAGLDHLAYMIYTSGSTGRPKGAQNTHGGIANRLLWMQQTFQLSDRDRVIQKTPFSFDVSVWEFFWPLLAGAALVIARPGGHTDPDYLLDCIAGERVTVAHFVPSMLQQLLAAQRLERAAPLRAVICSGEALAPQLQEQFFARVPAALYNLYGPTEAAVDVSSWACQRQSGQAGVPIGRPVANTQLYVLDQHMRPLPAGVPGELYIGGVQLARGYHNRPDLTAERFIPNPFSDQRPVTNDERRTTNDESGAEAGLPSSFKDGETRAGDVVGAGAEEDLPSSLVLRPSSARLYKTGDLARWRDDGAIEYLGRLDFQVKVRGVRIELGEIETALRRHPALQSAVVVARPDQHQQSRLVAYLVAAGAQPTVDELRAWLQRTLPDAMVPAQFVFLAALPLSANGKLDRRALPEPGQERPHLADAFVAPQDETEQRLAAVWREVLQIERVGVNDNFFLLGGDSILSLQVVSKAAAAGLQLTPRQLFEHPTVAQLARAATAAGATAAEQGPARGAAPLTPIQHWFFEQELPDPHHFNQSVLLRLRQPLDRALLERALARLADHHDALRLRFIRTAQGWWQWHADDAAPPSLGQISLAGLDEPAEAELVAAHGARLHTSFDLAVGPLLRAALFDGGPRPGYLLLVAHHLVVDGVSWRILLDDLHTAYGQLSRGEPVALPPKTTSYQQWASRLVEQADADALRDELPYWLSPARAAAPGLPLDNPRGSPRADRSRRVSVQLTEDQTDALLHRSAHAYRTQINDLLLAALVDACAHWSGSPALLVDLEHHGRDQPIEGIDLTRTVGWCTAITPVLLRRPEGAGWGELVKHVKEQLRELPAGGANYGLLRYLCRRPQADALRQQPQASLCFNYLGQFDRALGDQSLFQLADLPTGPARSGRGPRRYPIEISAYITKGRFTAEWSYSDAQYQAATVERVAQRYIETLGALVEHCRAQGSGGATPSDFALTGLNQRQLDAVLAKLQRRKEEQP